MRTATRTTTCPHQVKQSVSPADYGSWGSTGLSDAPSSDLSNLSPIVKSSLRRSSGKVHMSALRYSSKINGTRSAITGDTVNSKPLLPREILDRSLPASPREAGSSSSFAIKRKAVPPNLPAASTETPPAARKLSPPSKLATVNNFQSIFDSPLSTSTPPSIKRPISPNPAVFSPNARTRHIAGIRVKEAVEKIEHTHVSSAHQDLSTPVKAIGRIIDRPVCVSSAGLSREARQIMAEARLKRRR